MMTRRIVYGRGIPVASAADGPKDDPYVQRVIKLVPAEVVTFFVGINGIIQAAKGANSAWLGFAAFIAGVIFTPLYTRKIASDGGGNVSSKQLILTTVAFVVWAFAVSAPLTAFGYSDTALYGALALPTFTMIAGLVR
jgi:hypothetical protein